MARRCLQTALKSLLMASSGLPERKLLSGAAELASIEDEEIADRIGHQKYHDGFRLHAHLSFLKTDAW